MSKSTAEAPDFICKITQRKDNLWSMQAARLHQSTDSEAAILTAVVVLIDSIDAAAVWVENKNKLDVPENELLDVWSQGQIALALMHVYSDRANHRLCITVSAETGEKYRGHGYGTDVVKTAVSKIPEIITRLVTDLPTHAVIFFDDMSDPAGWTSHLAEKLGFTPQGSVCGVKTFSKQVLLKDK